MWQRAGFLVSVLWAVFLLGAPAHGQALHDIHGNAGVPCAACHQEQPASVAPPDATCVACHGTMIEEDGHEARFPDPHRSPHLGPGEIPACGDCHSIHGQSEVTCVMCHRGFQFDIK